jgi:diamine N-acetyltransferase
MPLSFIAIVVILLALAIFGYIRYKSGITNIRSTHSSAIKRTLPIYSISNATLNDIECIRSLALEIWPATYSETFSPQQVIYMLNKLFSETSLQRQMTSEHQYLVIKAGYQPIGFASYSEIIPSIFKLHKIYILPAYQGLGAGKFTMEKIIDVLTAKRATALTLNVNKHNPAKAFYEQLGFKIAKTEFSEVGDGYFINDYVMELKLSYQANEPSKERASQSY